MINDPYFSTKRCVERLYKQYEKHNNLIIGFDYDDTINDYNFYNWRYPAVIQLLQQCSNMGFTMILYSCKCPEELLKIKEKVEKIHKIKISYINESPIMEVMKKPYVNILLDDKAGLKQAHDILYKTIEKIKLKEE